MCAVPAFADPDVQGDDDTDSYRGVGSVLLSETWTGPTSQRIEAATCRGCRWSFHSSCRVNGMGCSSGSWATCPPGTARFDMRRSDGIGEPLTYRGTVCLGPRGPTPMRHVESAVRAEVARGLPPLAPRLASRAAVASTVSRVTVGVPTRAAFTMLVLEHRVQVRATARITWRWSTSHVMVSRESVVSHVWPTRGRARVSVSALWTADFSVDGLGPLPVEQNINQVGSFTTQVVGARPVLLVPTTGSPPGSRPG